MRSPALHGISLLLPIVCLLVAPAVARAGGMARIRQAGVLKWGGDVQGGEPFAWRDPDDPRKLLGFEVDLAAALGRELGVRAELVQSDWHHLVPALERGTFDVIMNGFEVTEGHKARVAFTRPYYVFAERLMVRRGDRRMSLDLASLRGMRVGTLEESLAHEALRKVTEPKLYEGVEEPYIDLVNGRLDAVLLDDIIATRYGAPKPELETVGDVMTGTYAIGVRPDELDVKEALDAALEKIVARGELGAILGKYRIYNERQKALGAGGTSTSTATASTAAAATATATSTPTSASAPMVTSPSSTLTFAQLVLFLRGALVTLLISTLAMAIAIPLGLSLALAQTNGPRWLQRAARAYVELYRGTPVLLQLYVLYYGLAPLVRVDAFTAAVLGLGMNYAAYEAETYRAGMMGVPRGQMEAAVSLGMSVPLALRRVVLPQAFRLALPNVANDFIALLKDSSLVSVITVVELTKQMTITAVDLRGWLVPGLLCAALYLAMSYPLGRIARRLEAKLERG
jgi:polar amino acid transport system substrate-binding protein